MHPEDYRKYAKYASVLVEQHQPVGFAYRIRRADGIFRWMQETSIPLVAKNQYEGYLATCLDISKLKRVGSHFAKALEASMDLEDIHSSLLPCLEDESNHAIAEGIKVADALIQNGQEMPQRNLAHLMNLAGQRMLSLVNGMLAFSSIKPKRTELISRPIRIRKMVTDIVEMLNPLRRSSGPRFQIDEKSDPFVVMADKVLLHRILETLIKSLQERAESRVITIDFAVHNGYGVVSIGHIGSILTDSFLNELSDLYRPNKSLSLFQRKSGLHLSLLKKLLQVMGGTLYVHHQEGVGPVITFRLKLEGTEHEDRHPAQPERAGHSQKAPSSPESAAYNRGSRPAVNRKARPEPQQRRRQREFGSSRQQLAEVVEAIDSLKPKESKKTPEPRTNGNGKHQSSEAQQAASQNRHRLLIGEHNRDTQRLIRSLLQPHYDLAIAPDIKGFLKQANEDTFDLFLLDIHMQSEDGRRGVDILRELRRMPQYMRTPIIAVASGNSGANKSELIDRGGFDDFLRKPYSIVELLETVEKMVNN